MTNHIPVLFKQTIEGLNIKDGGVYIDCTAGRGGHLAGILQSGKKDLTVIGIDKDPTNIKFLESKFSDSNLKLVSTDFKFFDDVMSFFKIYKADGILMDLGYSSTQIDDKERGFSFRYKAPLDMRYNNESDFLTAGDIVNTYSAEQLEKIFFEYGEERFSKKIVKNIIEARALKQIENTFELRRIIEDSIPNKFKATSSIDPSTRVFQALRIEVNSELKSIEESLTKVLDILNPGGRLCVISFHSLEDRIIKQFVNSKINTCTCPPKLPQCVCNLKPLMQWIGKNPITAYEDEIQSNPRSRSAKLRVAEKL